MHDFKSFRFGQGKHDSPDEGLCVMEAVAYISGEPHADHPRCASPVITELAIWLNDSYGSDDEARQQAFQSISPYRIAGTRGSAEIEQQRAFMAADFAVRFVCPRLLANAGLNDHADALRNLPVIDCENSARDAARAASDAARYAASDAARDAAYAARYAAYAASFAASDAAYYAASDAARYAAYAASFAASDAAYYAARDAAYVLDEIRTELIAAIDRMIRLTEIREAVPEAVAMIEAAKKEE